MTYTTPKAPSPPTAKYICFTRGGGKDADIYIMKSDGSEQKNPIRITTAPATTAAHFSPRRQTPPLSLRPKIQRPLQIFTADLAFDSSNQITGATKEHQLHRDRQCELGPLLAPGRQAHHLRHQRPRPRQLRIVFNERRRHA